MNTEYEEILNAARNARESMWELADALLKQFPILPIGTNNKPIRPAVQKVCEYLAENKIYFSAVTLIGLRFVADRFPKHERITGVSIWTHKTAGTPERLNHLISDGRLKPVREKVYERGRGNMSTPKHISVFFDRALDLASGCERISRGINPNARLAKQAIVISEAFGRVAAMLSPTRKEYIEQQ